MHHLPISLKVQHSNVAIIGNGETALNKLRLLVKNRRKYKIIRTLPLLCVDNLFAVEL